MNRIIGYKKTYKLRKLVRGRKYVTVAVPYEVVEREAARNELCVEDYIKKFVAVAEYDGFDGVRYTFVEEGNV